MNTPEGWKQELIEALKEAAAVLAGEAPPRVPLADELEGFAYMLADTPTPPEQQAAQPGLTVLPDGSAFATASWPLPEDHWLYAPRGEWDNERDDFAETPRPILNNSHRQAVIAAIRYAVRGATMCGQEMDFDPDALVQNACYALCGPARGSVLPADAQPEQPEPGGLTDEQIDAAHDALFPAPTFNHDRENVRKFARAIEREILASGRARPPIAASMPYRCTVITNESPDGIPFEQWVQSTNKLSDEEVARIMEAVRKLAVLSSDFAEGDCTGSAVDAAFANVERLLKGEA